MKVFMQIFWLFHDWKPERRGKVELKSKQPEIRLIENHNNNIANINISKPKPSILQTLILQPMILQNHNDNIATINIVANIMSLCL